MTTYCFSDTDDYFMNETDAETIKEAASTAFDYYGDHAPVYVGVKRELRPWQHVDADDILELIYTRTYDECGEACEGWPTVTKKEEQDLTDSIQNAIRKWLLETGNKPKFYAVDGIEKFEPEK